MGIINNQLSLILFTARVSAAVPNVTGSGTKYQVVFDDEGLDTDGIYNNATGLATAPLHGVYTFHTNVVANGLVAANTIFEVSFFSSTVGDIPQEKFDSTSFTGGEAAGGGSILIELPLGGTMYVELAISGDASDNSDLEVNSFFSGKLELDLT